MNYLPHVTDVAETYGLDATLLNATLYAFVMNLTDKILINTPQGEIDIMDLPEDVIDPVGQEVADTLFNDPGTAKLVGLAMHQVPSSEYEWSVFDIDAFANDLRIVVAHPDLVAGSRYEDAAKHAVSDLGWECAVHVGSDYAVTVSLTCDT